jgi:hypothetical protein
MCRALCVLSLLLLVVACASERGYDEPTSAPSRHSTLVQRSLADVWSAAIPALGRSFFVVNNIDKSSGFINLSYVGDPEKYVDCGQIHSRVKNLAGERSYDFPASRAEQKYELLDPGKLYLVTRQMSLDGRINVVFEPASAETTRVTVTAQYVLNKHSEVALLGGDNPVVTSQTISFTSETSAGYPPVAGQSTRCVATGRLESEILEQIR